MPFVDRVVPLTRHNYEVRGIKGSSVLDGNYLVDGGAERLVLQWKTERSRAITERKDTTTSTEDLDSDLANLLSKAGLPGFQPRRPEGLSSNEYINLANALAPNESDGPGDINPWNLFDEYLYTRKPGSLNNRHDLSEMLTQWRTDRVSK